MAAFNYIVFEASCPHCGKKSVIRVQTHIASDYEGDEGGRFMNHEYPLGERMRWFDRTHEDFETWKTWGGEGSVVREYCHATCGSCGAQLYALIEFADLVPSKVLEVGLRSNMPTT